MSNMDGDERPMKSIRNSVNHIIEWGTASFYLATVLVVLVMALYLTSQVASRMLLTHSVTQLVTLLDPILLLILFAEVLHAIALTIATHHLPWRAIVTVLFTAVVRHAIVIASTMVLASWDAGATLIAVVALSFFLIRLPERFAN